MHFFSTMCQHAGSKNVCILRARLKRMENPKRKQETHPVNHFLPAFFSCCRFSYLSVGVFILQTQISCIEWLSTSAQNRYRCQVVRLARAATILCSEKKQQKYILRLICYLVEINLHAVSQAIFPCGIQRTKQIMS